MEDPRLEEIDREVAKRRLDHLTMLQAERSTLMLVLMYPTMNTPEQRENAEKRLPELRALIDDEERRLASLRGEGFAERQLEDSQRLIEANTRMASAAEASAASSADAAHSARRAAFWTAIAATGSLIAAFAALVVIFKG